MIIKNATELVTCKGPGPKTGADMNDLGIIEDGAVVIEDGIVQAAGTTAAIMAAVDAADYEQLDAGGKCVLPGFIDSHNHFVFAGYRAEEFSWRLKGESYMAIMERGGGIMNTVRATRQASQAELTELAAKRLDTMLAMGVTTVEGKSGYGLDRDTELKQLEVMADLAGCHPVEIIPTFMGAHTVPPEYKGRSGEFIDFLISEVLPVVAERKLARFCDVFCEKGVFTVEESRRLLLAAQQLGLKSKLHADEIVHLGGAELASDLGAISADHLLQISDDGIARMAKSQTVATLLPATAFSLREAYARGRKLIDAGVPVALATDFNPGSCFTASIPLVVALAALNMKLTPAEIVTALTINAAAAVGEAHRLGSLEAGKQADILLLEYPSHLYLPYHIGMNIVDTVIKKGEVVWTKEKGGRYGKRQ